MNCFFVKIKFFVSNKVNVTSCTSVLSFTRWHVSFPYMSFSISQREERQIAVDTLMFVGHVNHCFALPGLRMLGEVCQVGEPTTSFTNIWKKLLSYDTFIKTQSGS